SLAGSQFARADHLGLATSVENSGFACPALPHMRTDRKPHIGEYEAKTNAICDIPRIAVASDLGRKMARRGDHGMRVVRYCPWFFSTRSQAFDILGRFCCRQARMVKSP